MATRVTLYRGIRAPSDKCEEVVEAHLRGELGPRSGQSTYLFWRLAAEERARLALLHDLSPEFTRPADVQAEGWIFATGDLMGAEHYAFFHGGGVQTSDVPLVLEVEVDLEALVIDGRDCLYTLSYGQHVRAVRAAIEAIYGPACVRWIEPASGRDSREATARVDLACQDLEVVRHHLAHQGVVAGRYGTLFRSSFMLRPSEAAARVQRIWTPNELQPRPAPDHILHDLMDKVRIR